MEELAYPDIVQQYHKTIVLYKGEPVHVSAVGQDKPTKVLIFFLLTQVTKIVDFNLVDFTAPEFRIGMVNVGGSVLYVNRVPVRKMQVGLNANNTSIQYIDGVNYEDGPMAAAAQLKGFNHIALGAAIKGQYPSFEECLDFIKHFQGAMAWERQFCIDHRRAVYYKRKLVGKLAKNSTRPEKITFDKGFEHLDILLGDNCGKSLAASRTR